MAVQDKIMDRRSKPRRGVIDRREYVRPVSLISRFYGHIGILVLAIFVALGDSSYQSRAEITQLIKPPAPLSQQVHTAIKKKPASPRARKKRVQISFEDEAGREPAGLAR